MVWSLRMFRFWGTACSLTMRSNSMRGINLSIRLNMLHDALTMGLLRSDAVGFSDSSPAYGLEDLADAGGRGGN